MKAYMLNPHSSTRSRIKHPTGWKYLGISPQKGDKKMKNPKGFKAGGKFAKLLKKRGGNLKAAHKDYRKWKGLTRKGRKKKSWKKGTKHRVSVTSMGVKRGKKTIFRTAKRSPGTCAREYGRNPSRIRRSTRKRTYRRKNPGVMGIFRTLTNVNTYTSIGIATAGGLAAVGATRWIYSQTVGRYLPAVGPNTVVGNVALAGMSFAVAGFAADRLVKNKKTRDNIMMAAGVLASAGLIKNLVAMASPRAAAYLGDYMYVPGSAMPAGQYGSGTWGRNLGDWVSPQTGLGDYLSVPELMV